MTQFFRSASAADRYDQFRPKVHGVVRQWLQKHSGRVRFQRAIDVGCGTGDSLYPLLEVADEVIGIDSSEGMLSIARGKGLNVVQLPYTELPSLGRFDLLSTCMAFHWFDYDLALRAYKGASSPGAIWLIYNFAFAGHTSNDTFNDWLANWYLKTFPSPVRAQTNESRLEQEGDLTLLSNETGWLPVEFSRSTLVGYLTTQSNVENVIINGGCVDTIAQQLHDSLAGLEIAGPFKYSFRYRMLEYRGA